MDELHIEARGEGDERSELQPTDARHLAGRPAEASLEDALARRLVGRSPAMQRLRQRLAGLAPLSTPVLVEGEPGSGRDAAARALHELGGRGERLRRIDAAGFEPPRANGAAARLLRHELAASPVLLADVDDLPPAGQAFWLHRLVEGGGGRVLATCRAPLHARAGYLPELARALERFAVRVPPLSRRRADLPAIARSLARRCGRGLGRPHADLSERAGALLRDELAPASLAELAGWIERGVAFSPCGRIEVGDLRALQRESRTSVEDLRRRRDAEERAALLRALEESGGNITRTAERLGRSRPGVYRLIEKHHIPLARARAGG